MRAALARHHSIIRDAIQQSNGYVFKTMGDAFCAAFPTAAEALQAASTAQLTLAANQRPSETTMRVRMALHTGGAESRDDDYFGPSLNRVSRLLSSAHGAQVEGRPVDIAVIHNYPVAVNWSGGRGGAGSVRPEASGVEIPIAVPVEFQGPGGATNPEELLTSAIASCYTITFGIIAANRKLPVTSLKTEAIGEVDQQGASFTYKKITIRPQILANADATEAEVGQIADFAHKADLYCIVTNAVRGKVEVVVDPTVSVAQPI